jgi:hypothetical protein
VLNQTSGAVIEYKPGVEDSDQQFTVGTLQLRENVFYDVAGNDSLYIFGIACAVTTEDLTAQIFTVREYFTAAGNRVENPGMIYTGGQFGLVAGDYVFGGLSPYPDQWFDRAHFQGAFGTYNWASGWTLLSRSGILPD